jgi:hypothetical protein
MTELYDIVTPTNNDSSVTRCTYTDDLTDQPPVHRTGLILWRDWHSNTDLQGCKRGRR